MDIQDNLKTTAKNASQASKNNKTLGAKALKSQLQEKSSARRSQAAASTRVVASSSSQGRNDLQPALEVRELPVDKLKPSPTRARITTPEQLEKIISSIKQFGLVTFVLIDHAKTIIAGHGIWEAARSLGLKTIRCVRIEHLDEHEVEAFSLALNRIGETGTWDLDALGKSLIRLESAGIKLENTGFSLPEIDQITLGMSADTELIEESSEEDCSLDLTPVVQAGDMFELETHRLLCGDALESSSYATLLEGNKAHCVVSDAPFNCPIAGFVSGLGKNKHADFQHAVGELNPDQFTQFLQTYLTHCKASTSAGAIIFAFMDWRQIEKLLSAGLLAGLTRKNIAIWNKGSGGMGSLYRSAHELVAVFCNGKTPAINNIELGRHGRDRTNVWSYPGANKPGTSAASALADHPTPKNISMIEDAILDATNRGDIVLDPFLGSGTTLIAAENTARRCAAIELEPKYVESSIRRWEKLTGNKAVHVATGKTLDDLHQDRSAGEGEGS